MFELLDLPVSAQIGPLDGISKLVLPPPWFRWELLQLPHVSANEAVVHFSSYLPKLS
jgi:hypothetical protein